MPFSVTTCDGDTTSVKTFTLNAATGTKVFLENIRIRGWYIVATDRAAFLYSDSEGGVYVPIYSGEWSGQFKNGTTDTVGWFKSQTGSLVIYVLFIY